MLSYRTPAVRLTGRLAAAAAFTAFANQAKVDASERRRVKLRALLGFARSVPGMIVTAVAIGGLALSIWPAILKLIHR